MRGRRMDPTNDSFDGLDGRLDPGPGSAVVVHARTSAGTLASKPPADFQPVAAGSVRAHEISPGWYHGCSGFRLRFANLLI